MQFYGAGSGAGGRTGAPGTGGGGSGAPGAGAAPGGAMTAPGGAVGAVPVSERCVVTAMSASRPLIC